MADEGLENAKFTWGDCVRVKADAPAKYLLHEFSNVCGISVIDNDVRSQQFGEPFGTFVYIVEAGNGQDTEIPERYLEPYDYSSLAGLR